MTAVPPPSLGRNRSWSEYIRYRRPSKSTLRAERTIRATPQQHVVRQFMVGAFGPVRHRVDRSGGDVGVTEKPAIAVTVSCQERQPAATAELEYLGHFGDVVLARGERRRQVFPVDQVVRPDAGDAVRVHQFAAVTEAGGVEADPSAARIAHDAQVACVFWKGKGSFRRAYQRASGTMTGLCGYRVQWSPSSLSASAIACLSTVVARMQ